MLLISFSYEKYFCSFHSVVFCVNSNFANAATETIVIQPGPEEGKDTYFGIGSVGGRDGRPDSEALRIGGWGDTWVTYIQFHLDELPTEAEIKSASLQLYQWRTDSSANRVRFYRVTEQWNESDPGHTDYPHAVDFGMAYTSIPTSDWLIVDVTEITQNWFAGLYPNYGLKLLAERSADDTNYVKEFWSSDYLDDPSLRPKLVITYEMPDPTPEEVVEDLEGIVENEIDKKEVQNSYLAHIKKFLDFFDKEQIHAALNQVSAFVKKVSKDLQKGDIPTETAEELQELGNDLQEKIETSSSESDVPLITQVASPYPPESSQWASAIYANGSGNNPNDPNPCGLTVAECGCALASMSMLGHSYGIATDINGDEVNPGNMNAWLEENGGYTPLGGLWWSKALAYMGKEDGDGYKSKLSLLSEQISDVDGFLAQDKPVIAFNESKGHYFVLTEKNENGSYDVRDPYWYMTQTTNDTKDTVNNVQDYNNDIDKVKLFEYHDQPQKLADALEIHLASPAELLLTDSEGRRTGYDFETGEVLQEIPGSSYDQTSAIYTTTGIESNPHFEKVLLVDDTQDDVYTLEVIGTGEGEYTLSTLTINEGGSFATESIVAITEEGQTDTYLVDVEVGNGELQAIIDALYAAAEDLPEDDQVKIAHHLDVIADKVGKENTVASESTIVNLLAYIAKKDIANSEELTALLQELLASLE